MGESDIDREMEEIRKRRAKPAQPPKQMDDPDTGDAMDEMHEIDEMRAAFKRKGEESKGLVADEAAPADMASSDPEPEEPEERIYVVKAGDNLSKISQEVYGKAGRWREIYEANKDQIENPNLIRPGWKLRIP